jgi:hypothetical protein
MFTFSLSWLYFKLEVDTNYHFSKTGWTLIIHFWVWFFNFPRSVIFQIIYCANKNQLKNPTQIYSRALNRVHSVFFTKFLVVRLWGIKTFHRRAHPFCVNKFFKCSSLCSILYPSNLIYKSYKLLLRNFKMEKWRFYH